MTVAEPPVEYFFRTFYNADEEDGPRTRPRDRPISEDLYHSLGAQFNGRAFSDEGTDPTALHGLAALIIKTHKPQLVASTSPTHVHFARTSEPQKNILPSKRSLFEPHKTYLQTITPIGHVLPKVVGGENKMLPLDPEYFDYKPSADPARPPRTGSPAFSTLTSIPVQRLINLPRPQLVHQGYHQRRHSRTI